MWGGGEGNRLPSLLPPPSYQINGTKRKGGGEKIGGYFFQSTPRERGKGTQQFFLSLLTLNGEWQKVSFGIPQTNKTRDSLAVCPLSSHASSSSRWRGKKSSPPARAARETKRAAATNFCVCFFPPPSPSSRSGASRSEGCGLPPTTSSVQVPATPAGRAGREEGGRDGAAIKGAPARAIPHARQRRQPPLAGWSLPPSQRRRSARSLAPFRPRSESGPALLPPPPGSPPLPPPHRGRSASPAYLAAAHGAFGQGGVSISPGWSRCPTGRHYFISQLQRKSKSAGVHMEGSRQNKNKPKKPQKNSTYTHERGQKRGEEETTTQKRSRFPHAQPSNKKKNTLSKEKQKKTSYRNPPPKNGRKKGKRGDKKNHQVCILIRAKSRLHNGVLGREAGWEGKGFLPLFKKLP